MTLAEIHAALQRLVYEQGRINPDEVDITFEAPTRERIDRLTRPAINLFLFDLQENTELRQTNWQSGRENGHATRRMPPRRIDLRYMVSALSSAIEDEHALLWRTLATLLSYPELPGDLLPADTPALEAPIAARVTPSDEGRRLLDIWSALGVPPRPAFYYVVTAPVDLDITIQSPLVLTRTARYRVSSEPGAEAVERIHLGGVVRDEAGVPQPGVLVSVEGAASAEQATDGEGRYRLRDVAPGLVSLRLTRADGSTHTAEIRVPADSYDLVLSTTPTPAGQSPARRGQRSKSAQA